jgi:hypothetical protein
MAISETVLILAGGTAVLSILFGIRLAMRAAGGAAAAPQSDGGEAPAAGGSGAVAGVIALPPLIFLGFLVAAVVLEAPVRALCIASVALSGRSPTKEKDRNRVHERLWGVARKVMGGILKFLRFGALNLFSRISGMLPNWADMGKSWARADLFFLKDSLERGMSLAEIAGFLRRTADEVREKGKDLNKSVSRNRGRGPRLV